MTVPIDYYNIHLWKAGAQCQFFFFFAYCLLHAAFSPSRGMVKSQGHSDKGFNVKIPKVTMQHTNGGW